MWSPPRSLSTTVERALIENKAIHVLHEPFGRPYYWSSQAGSSRQDGESRCQDTYQSIANSIFHDAPPPGKRFVFSKNLSYYFAPHCIPQMVQLLGADYSRIRHSFMIRHPAKAIASLYHKSCIDNEKTGYTHFDPAEAGYAAMAALLEHLDAVPECPPPVILDADDLLEDPDGLMAAYCAACGLPYDSSMLSWAPGPVPELASPWKGWTDDVQASSGITKRPKRSLPPVTTSLPSDVQQTIAEAMPIYEAMYARRVRAAKPASNGSADANEWGKAETPRGEPCLVSPCLKACFADPALVTGTVLLVTSVLIWVGQAELLQHIQSEQHWSKPYFLAASLKSAWALTLPIWMLLSKFNEAFQNEITFRRPLRPTLRIVLFCAMLTVLVQTSSATWISSLNLTSVSINSAIYNINPLLVYVFSIPLLRERPSVTKTGAVLLAMAGTTIVTLGTASSGAAVASDGAEASAKEGAVVGNVLVLLSASLFALKEVLFKRHFPSISISLTPFTDALLVVSLIGVISAVTLLPLTYLLDATGIETFVMPTPELMRSYALVAACMASYQACLLAAIALTSPTYVAMGTMLAVPASIGFDFVLKAYVVPPVALLGILALLAAFALLIFAERIEPQLCRARADAMRSCGPRKPLADGHTAPANGATALV